MARLLKNPTIGKSNILATQLPIVPDSSYGDSPVNGLLRFNLNPLNDTGPRIEFYYNGGWSRVAKIGTVQLVVDSFQGDGTTSMFTMTQPESDPTAVAVFVGGVYQQPTTNYTVNGSTVLTLTSPPPAYTGTSPTTIVIIHNINSTDVPA